MKDSNGSLPVPYLLALASIAFLLVAAFGRLPIGAYTMLRILICVSSGFWFFIAHENENSWWAYAFFINMVMFNPLFPLYLRRQQWKPIDIGDAVFFAMWLAYWFQVEKKQPKASARPIAHQP